MATGPEHYLIAEGLLDKQAEEAAQRGDTEIEAISVAHAQAHATLALAAATALSQFGEFPTQDCEAWLEAASGSPYRPAS